jgi:G3E family GTPase
LVNEFGSLGLDGAAIQEMDDGLQVVEMAGGCICCSQKLALAESVADIARRFRPHRLFIEPSGIAEASEVIGILTEGQAQELVRLDGVIAIVDAETFLDYSQPDAFGTFFRDQLANADMVVVNKTDLIDDGHLQAVTKRLQAVNPTALFIPASYCSLTVSLSEGRVRPLFRGNQRQHGWEYVCLQPEGRFSRESLHDLAAQIDQGIFGKILRAKGVVRAEGGQYLHLHLVGHRWCIEQRDSAIRPRLTCIGFNLDRRRLQAFLASGRDRLTTLFSTTDHELS